MQHLPPPGRSEDETELRKLSKKTPGSGSFPWFNDLLWRAEKQGKLLGENPSPSVWLCEIGVEIRH